MKGQQTARDKRSRSRSRSKSRERNSASTKQVKINHTPTQQHSSPQKQTGYMRKLDSSMRERLSVEVFKEIDCAVGEVISSLEVKGYFDITEQYLEGVLGISFFEGIDAKVCDYICEMLISHLKENKFSKEYLETLLEGKERDLTSEDIKVSFVEEKGKRIAFQV